MSTCLLHIGGFGWRVGVIWLPWHDYNSRTAAFQLAHDLPVGLCQPSLPLVSGLLFLQLTSSFTICKPPG